MIISKHFLHQSQITQTGHPNSVLSLLMFVAKGFIVTQAHFVDEERGTWNADRGPVFACTGQQSHANRVSTKDGPRDMAGQRKYYHIKRL